MILLLTTLCRVPSQVNAISAATSDSTAPGSTIESVINNEHARQMLIPGAYWLLRPSTHHATSDHPPTSSASESAPAAVFAKLSNWTP
ncbi:hypothetical protein BDW66DRAFT_143109 [Aspergillus desertorum]